MDWLRIRMGAVAGVVVGTELEMIEARGTAGRRVMGEKREVRRALAAAAAAEAPVGAAAAGTASASASASTSTRDAVDDAALTDEVDDASDAEDEEDENENDDENAIG
jgi:hypothetical protein